MVLLKARCTLINTSAHLPWLCFWVTYQLVSQEVVICEESMLSQNFPEVNEYGFSTNPWKVFSEDHHQPSCLILLTAYVSSRCLASSSFPPLFWQWTSSFWESKKQRHYLSYGNLKLSGWTVTIDLWVVTQRLIIFMAFLGVGPDKKCNEEGGLVYLFSSLVGFYLASLGML